MLEKKLMILTAEMSCFEKSQEMACLDMLLDAFPRIAPDRAASHFLRISFFPSPSPSLPRCAPSQGSGMFLSRAGRGQ